MSDDLCRLYRRPGGAYGELVLVLEGRAYDLGEVTPSGRPAAVAHDGAGPEATRGLHDWLTTPGARQGALRDAARAGRFSEAAGIDPREDLLPPLVPREIGKLLCLGKNFRAHAEEFGEDVPSEPMFFNKLPETVVGHGATVTVPTWYRDRFDHEAELACVIGGPGRDIAPERALEHVAGYTVANDLTARTMQGQDRDKKYPWFRAKNFEHSCPLGPCLVPTDAGDASPDTTGWRVRATVNGETRQDATIAQLVVAIPQALAWLSRHLTLNTGDVVLMGTPAGVGPLADGDVVICSVDAIGELATVVARP